MLSKAGFVIYKNYLKTTGNSSDLLNPPHRSSEEELNIHKKELGRFTKVCISLNNSGKWKLSKFITTVTPLAAASHDRSNPSPVVLSTSRFLLFPRLHDWASGGIAPPRRPKPTRSSAGLAKPHFQNSS